MIALAKEVLYAAILVPLVELNPPSVNFQPTPRTPESGSTVTQQDSDRLYGFFRGKPKPYFLFNGPSDRVEPDQNKIILLDCDRQRFLIDHSKVSNGSDGWKDSDVDGAAYASDAYKGDLERIEKFFIDPFKQDPSHQEAGTVNVKNTEFWDCLDHFNRTRKEERLSECLCLTLAKVDPQLHPFVLTSPGATNQTLRAYDIDTIDSEFDDYREWKKQLACPLFDSKRGVLPHIPSRPFCDRCEGPINENSTDADIACYFRTFSYEGQTILRPGGPLTQLPRGGEYEVVTEKCINFNVYDVYDEFKLLMEGVPEDMPLDYVQWRWYRGKQVNPLPIGIRRVFNNETGKLEGTVSQDELNYRELEKLPCRLDSAMGEYLLWRNFLKRS